MAGHGPRPLRSRVAELTRESRCRGCRRLIVSRARPTAQAIDTPSVRLSRSASTSDSEYRDSHGLGVGNPYRASHASRTGGRTPSNAAASSRSRVRSGSGAREGPLPAASRRVIITRSSPTPTVLATSCPLGDTRAVLPRPETWTDDPSECCACVRELLQARGSGSDRPAETEVTEGSVLLVEDNHDMREYLRGCSCRGTAGRVAWSRRSHHGDLRCRGR